MSDVCHGCGLQAVGSERFAEGGWFSGSGKKLCLNCNQKRSNKINLAWLGAALFAGMLALVQAQWNGQNLYDHFLFRILVIQIFLTFLILPHELGHAYMAKFLGIKVTRVALGMGKHLAGFRAIGFRFDVFQLPFGGMTFLENAGLTRLKNFLIVAAGPLVNIALALGASHFFPPHPLTGLFVAANYGLAVLNLIPFQWVSSFGRTPTDGFQLLNLATNYRFGRIASRPGRNKTSNRSASVTKWLASLFLGFLALLCLILAILLGYIWGNAAPGTQPQTARAALIASVFMLSLTIVLGFIIRRLWKKKAASPILGYASVLNQVQEAIERLRPVLFQGGPKTVGNILDDAANLIKSGSILMAEGLYVELLQLPNLPDAARLAFTQSRASAILHSGDPERAFYSLQGFLNSPADTQLKVYLLDSMACTVFMEEQRSFLPYADILSEQALTLQPGNLTLIGTRSSIHSELGRFDIAEPMLQHILAQSESSLDRGIASFYLALGEKAKGNFAKAQKHQQQARGYLHVPWLIKRLDQEFGQVT
ncbi:MAG: site-2 protease family protein [Verrucomicrobiales bacterium]